MPKKRETKVEPYWSEFVSCYYSFCKNKFSTIPSFDGSAPRDLKLIIQSLRKRAEEQKVEWTQEVAIARFISFLEYAFSDWWLSENWMLSNINRKKDTVFFKIAKAKK